MKSRYRSKGGHYIYELPSNKTEDSLIVMVQQTSMAVAMPLASALAVRLLRLYESGPNKI